jgi:hypothetical protein
MQVKGHLVFEIQFIFKQDDGLHLSTVMHVNPERGECRLMDTTLEEPEELVL